MSFIVFTSISVENTSIWFYLSVDDIANVIVADSGVVKILGQWGRFWKQNLTKIYNEERIKIIPSKIRTKLIY